MRPHGRYLYVKMIWIADIVNTAIAACCIQVLCCAATILACCTELVKTLNCSFISTTSFTQVDLRHVSCTFTQVLFAPRTWQWLELRFSSQWLSHVPSLHCASARSGSWVSQLPLQTGAAHIAWEQSSHVREGVIGHSLREGVIGHSL